MPGSGLRLYRGVGGAAWGRAPYHPQLWLPISSKHSSHQYHTSKQSRHQLDPPTAPPRGTDGPTVMHLSAPLPTPGSESPSSERTHSFLSPNTTISMLKQHNSHFFPLQST